MKIVVAMKAPLCQKCGREMLKVSQHDLDGKLLTTVAYHCIDCERYYDG